MIFDAKNGYIVTNAHVIENASEITVTLQDGQDLKAESSAGTHLGRRRAEGEIRATLTQVGARRFLKVEVGDFVVAIGNPFGLQHTVTSGIISGLSRSGITPDGYEDFIQTDASINPGNSGGALVNLKGELIGINTAILSRSGGNIGIGFAIPVNMARKVMDQLLKFGTVKRGVLGVNIYNVTPDIAQLYGLGDTQGALVSQVVEGSRGRESGHSHGRRHHLREQPDRQIEYRAAARDRSAAGGDRRWKSASSATASPEAHRRHRGLGHARRRERNHAERIERHPSRLSKARVLRMHRRAVAHWSAASSRAARPRRAVCATGTSSWA